MSVNEKKVVARFQLVDTKGVPGGRINPPLGLILEDNSVLWDNPIKAKMLLGQIVTNMEELNSSCATINFVV